jgi:1,2-diacylglycerol 3-alpha-glucosyltransferase
MKNQGKKNQPFKNTDDVLAPRQVTKVFFVCPGLGNINRGFESFTRECFDALSQDDSIDITLFKGGGNFSKKEIILWNLPREKWITIQISRVVGWLTGIKGSYNTEQLSFFVSLLPHIYQQKPDVIYFSDEQLGVFLWYWRRLTRQNYKLLFSNGAPVFPPNKLFRWDHVQQIAPSHLRDALNVGIPAENQSLIPYGIQIASQGEILSSRERQIMRYQLGLPEERPLVLSVGIINKSHKRMDYVIRELANLPEPRPYLLLLGQQEEDSSEIIQLGNKLLGTDNFQARTVVYSEIHKYYQVADVFVLASLNEGFGRVFLEAMNYGLPCLAHDYEVTRFILEDQGYLANFQISGSLTYLIPKALSETENLSKRQFSHLRTFERFSWERLRQSYVKLIQQCINS